MKRSLVVILAGFLSSLLFVSLGTKVVMALSASWGAVGRSTGYESMMVVMMHSFRALVAFVYVPTALVIGFVVGRFSQKRQISSAILATCPAWILLLAVPPWGTPAGVLIVGAGVLGAWMSKRVPHIRPGSGATVGN